MTVAAMSPEAIADAAQVLATARRAGTTIDRLPEALRPATPQDALAIQRRVTALLGVAVGGWKCSVPNAARPIVAAPIHAPDITSTSPCAMPVHNGIARIEPEVAFVVGRDLPPRAHPYTDDEIRAAIREARLVLELVNARYADSAAVTYPELLADDVANHGLFLGPAIGNGSDPALASFMVRVESDTGVILEREGRHPDRHPLLPFLWLANFLATHEGGLRAGQIVTTGSYVGLVEVPSGRPLTIRFGGFGSLALTLVAS
jgi:2-keto-4-pentenoate hydratase